jgi:hypothetical protein
MQNVIHGSRFERQRRVCQEHCVILLTQTKVSERKQIMSVDIIRSSCHGKSSSRCVRILTMRLYLTVKIFFAFLRYQYFSRSARRYKWRFKHKEVGEKTFPSDSRHTKYGHTNVKDFRIHNSEALTVSVSYIHCLLQRVRVKMDIVVSLKGSAMTWLSPR